MHFLWLNTNWHTQWRRIMYKNFNKSAKSVTRVPSLPTTTNCKLAFVLFWLDWLARMWAFLLLIYCATWLGGVWMELSMRFLASPSTFIEILRTNCPHLVNVKWNLIKLKSRTGSDGGGLTLSRFKDINMMKLSIRWVWAFWKSYNAHTLPDSMVCLLMCIEYVYWAAQQSDKNLGNLFASASTYTNNLPSNDH